MIIHRSSRLALGALLIILLTPRSGSAGLRGAELTARKSVPISGATEAIAFDPEGRLIAIGKSDGTVAIFFAEDGRASTDLAAHKGPVRALVFSRDGNMLYTGGADGKITGWDPATGSNRWSFPAHEGAVRGLAISKFGGSMITSGDDGRVRSFDLGSNQFRESFQDTMPLGSLAIASDGKVVLANATATGLVANERTVRIFDLEELRLLRTLTEPRITSTAVAMASSADRSVATFQDGRIAVFKATNTEDFEIFPSNTGAVRGAALHRDGRFLATVSDERVVQIWDLPNHVELKRGTLKSKPSAVSFDPAGVSLAVVTEGELVLFDVSQTLRNAPMLPQIVKLEEARTLMNLRKSAEAKAPAEEALRLDPKLNEARVFIAKAKLDAGDPEGAISTFKAIAQDSPNDPIANLVLGLVARNEQRTDDAIGNWTRALNGNPNNYEQHMLIASTELKREHYVSAGRHNLAALDMVPNDVNLMYSLASTYAIGKQASRSLDWLEAALKGGIRGFDVIHNDPALANVRGSPRYRELMVKYSKTEDLFRTGGKLEKVNELKVRAKEAHEAGKNLEGVELYKKVLTEERAMEKPRIETLRMWHFRLALDAYEAGLDDLSEHHFEECLAINNHLSENDDATRLALSYLALVYARIGKPLKALETYDRAAGSHREKNEKDMLASVLTRAAGELIDLGRFDEALTRLEEAERLAKEVGGDPGATIGLEVAETIARLYGRWGQPRKAMAKAGEVLATTRRLGDKNHLVGRLIAMGDLYRQVGEIGSADTSYKEAVAIADELAQPGQLTLVYGSYSAFLSNDGRRKEAAIAAETALKWARRTNQPSSLLIAISASGLIQSQSGNKDDARKLFEEAVEISRKNSREDRLAHHLALAGVACRETGQFDKAEKYLEEALAIRRKLDLLPGTADALSKLGQVFYEEEKWEASSLRFAEAVQIYESLRKQARGDARREFLASQILAYRWLTAVQLHANKTFDAYRTIELSRAKLLAEQLAVRESDVTIPTTAEIQELAGTGAIITYANSDVGEMAAMVIDHEGILPKVRGLRELIKEGSQETSSMVASLAKDDTHRGFRRVTAREKPPAMEPRLADVVQRYRDLLKDEGGNEAELKRLGRLFYTHLIKPMEDRIAGKKELMIVPDGALALIPFETFIDDQGRYLGDKFDVRYVQSLSVLRLIGKRKYSSNRKPLLAFGGAIYEKPEESSDPSTDVRRRYAALGYEYWEPLPGTLSEVKSIANTVRNSDIITGEAVDEANVKAMSLDGRLANYRVIHFATHGTVVPEATEMSALVLSQFGKARNGEDGYLSMSEIGALKMNADFVALSACETGLGRIYDGEGLVGLSQAFLIAGANALSVSLWQVPDQSTSKLMSEVYRLVETKHMSWGAALAEVKRDFSRGTYGKEWKAPHYWAPFVYYGGN